MAFALANSLGCFMCFIEEESCMRERERGRQIDIAETAIEFMHKDHDIGPTVIIIRYFPNDTKP